MSDESITVSPVATTNKRRRAGLILLLLAMVGLIIGLRWWFWHQGHIQTDNAFVESHIHTVATRVPGQVKRVLVIDNQLVRRGDLLVELDSSDFQVRVAAARATLDLAKQEITDDEPRQGSVRAEIEQARARLNQADSDLKRGKSLFIKEVISREQLERLETARAVDVQKVKEKEEELRKVQAELGLAGSGGRKARIALREAQAQEAGLNLSYTQITAPVDGYVTRKGVETGAYVQPGQPLMTVVALQNAWVTANYKESQLTFVRPGQTVTFTVDSYPGRTFRGTVESIMAGTGAAFSLLPPENATGNYVKVVQRVPVKIRIDGSSDPDHLLRVGMSVVPIIDAQRRASSIFQELNPFAP